MNIISSWSSYLLILHLYVSAGVVSEPKSQAAEAGAGRSEAPPPRCAPSSQGAAAGVQHVPTVLSSTPGSPTAPFLDAPVGCVFSSPRPGRPVPLQRRPTTAEAARRLVQPAEEQPQLSSVLLGLHAASGPMLPLELSGHNLERIIHSRNVLCSFNVALQ